MKHLFVCSRPVMGSDKQLHRHLLGILYQDENGQFKFEYRLDNSSDSDLLLPIFPDKNKIYNDRDTRLLLDDYLPSENDTAFIQYILDKANMSEYNEWDWLKAFDSDDDSETRLYETLPPDVVCHGDLSDIIISDENDENDADDYCELFGEKEYEGDITDLFGDIDDIDDISLLTETDFFDNYTDNIVTSSTEHTSPTQDDTDVITNTPISDSLVSTITITKVTRRAKRLRQQPITTSDIVTIMQERMEQNRQARQTLLQTRFNNDNQ